MRSQYSIIFSLFCFLPVNLLVLVFAGEIQAGLVSVNRDSINMRSGPGLNYKILWQLERGYPLWVIQSSGKWYKVRDFEGDTGWVYAPLTSRKPHVVIKKSRINVRSGPGTKYPIVAKASKGVVFRTIKQVKGWVKVRHEEGVTGWVARHLVWGW